MLKELQGSNSPDMAPGPSEQRELRSVIERIMDERRPYLAYRYSLDDLARDVGVPRHRLSSIFGKDFGVNFPTYVNKKRIEFLLENLGNPDWDRYTLEGIGRACGFNSRNSFIKCIKRFLGKNPSEVIRRREG